MVYKRKIIGVTFWNLVFTFNVLFLNSSPSAYPWDYEIERDFGIVLGLWIKNVLACTGMYWHFQKQCTGMYWHIQECTGIVKSKCTGMYWVCDKNILEYTGILIKIYSKFYMKMYWDVLSFWKTIYCDVLVLCNKNILRCTGRFFYMTIKKLQYYK